LTPGGPDPRDPEGSGSAEPADQGAPAVVAGPPHVNTDQPVDTETVDVPPVTIATVDRTAGQRRVSGRVAAVVGVVAALAIGAVAYTGYSLNQDLSATRATLATTKTDLGSMRTTLDETSSTLATTRIQLTDKTEARESLDAEIVDLSAQVATQTDCVDQQKDALADLISISDLQTANFNRTAEGSAWETAEKKRSEGIDEALDQFYEAYKAAFEGSTGTATSHSDSGKVAQARIAEAEAQEAAELALVDQKAAEVQVAIDALEQQLVTIEATCAGVAP
jgi:septal ring factor EnvC (AmiA/AmiB activator)